MPFSRLNSWPRLAVWAVLLLSCAASGVACAAEEDAPAPVEAVEVVYRLPHDASAFTQGLFFHEGRLYETTGRRGRSHLAELDPATGETLRLLSLPAHLFGEGATAVGGQCYWLTWTSGRALVVDLDDFSLVREFDYRGEGWGLTGDGGRLYMSDGGASVTLRDPADFRATGSIEVRDAGRPVPRLNELEWAHGLLYANVWYSPHVLVVDPGTGRVLRRLDLSPLVPARAEAGAVANGIAYDEKNRCLLVTGKLWPEAYCVRRLGDPGRP